MPASLCRIAVLLLVAIAPASAQDAAAPAPASASPADAIDPTPPGTLNPAPLPPLANPNSPSTPAKELFGRKLTPFPGPPRPIGAYADGCLAGAVPLPITGPSLASDAAVARPQLGHAATGFLHRAARRRTPRKPAGTGF